MPYAARLWGRHTLLGCAPSSWAVSPASLANGRQVLTGRKDRELGKKPSQFVIVGNFHVSRILETSKCEVRRQAWGIRREQRQNRSQTNQNDGVLLTAGRNTAAFSSTKKPIFLFLGSGGIMSWRTAAKRVLIFESCVMTARSNSSNLMRRSLWSSTVCRSRMKARTTYTLIRTACRLLSTLAAIIAPCSVNT